MKAMIIFYASCTLILYATLVFIGYRNKHLGTKNFLPEVVVLSTPSKVGEATILAHHFDRCIGYVHARLNRDAADEIYNALMVLTVRTVAGGNYDRNAFTATLNDLKDCYIQLARKNSNGDLRQMENTFERAELFVAQTNILKSKKDVDNNELKWALEDINRAEESIAAASHYAAPAARRRDKELFDGSRHYLNDVIREMDAKPWKQVKIKLGRFDDKLEGRELN